MEKQLKLIMLLSLKEMALRRVAVLLWSDSNVLASISKIGMQSQKEWQETTEDKIKDKMSKLELPKSLMKQMIDTVRPIGLQIQKYDRVSDIVLSDLTKLCWNTAGTINCRKTEEEILRSDVFDIYDRYMLACKNCLEDYIPLLWEELPEVMKEHYYNGKNSFSILVYCWPHILKGELSKLDYLWRTEDRTLTSFNQWAFEHSAEKGNKSAAECFYQKLTHEEREASLMRTAHALLAEPHPEYIGDKIFPDLLCYLLALMTPEQQVEILKEHPSSVLLNFLYRPWPDLYVENADLIWAFLPPSGYSYLLDKMADIFDKSDFYFPKLFLEFFMQSPLDLKKYFVLTHACRFLSVFFRCEDSESVKVIFRNVDAADRVKIVFNCGVSNGFYGLISEDSLQMTELCLREATLSKEDKKRWKKGFIKYLMFVDPGEFHFENPNFKTFLEFLDETDTSADKEKKAQKRKLENCCPE